MHPSCVARARLAVACIALALPVTGRPQAAPEPQALPTFRSAITQWNAGQHAQALSVFEALAQAGDARSQLLLGLTYLEGKYVAKDAARGYAWLQIATAEDPYAFGRSAVAAARQQKGVAELQLPGADLIHGDTLAGSFLAAHAQDYLQRRTAAGVALLGRDAASNAAVLTGCALDRNLPGCESLSKDVDLKGACTGDIPRPDSRPNGDGPSARIVQPAYPEAAKARGWEGVIALMAHVDRSGYVCRYTVIRGSGEEPLDTAATAAVRSWRFTPAMKDGKPVEGLVDFRIEFLLDHYALGSAPAAAPAGKP